MRRSIYVPLKTPAKQALKPLEFSNPMKTLTARNGRSGDMPKHVRKKRAKGHTYYYFNTGLLNKNGKPVLLRLPPLGTAKFDTALKRALRDRFKRETRVIPAVERRAVPFGDFDPSVLEGGDVPVDGDDLYFIRAGDAVKIGRAVDVWRRMGNMQSNNHEELDCICRLPGRGHEERQWQAHFRDHWIRGEWFEWTEELAEAIELANQGKPWWRKDEAA